jgi:hypothetical protein
MDMGRDQSLPQSIDLRDRNMAALALAEAMERVREGAGGASETAASGGGVVPDARHQLDALRGRLEPLFAAIPADAEGFDLGFVTHSKPRLFIDMLTHVAFDPESRAFRLVQETRNGRRVLLETLDETVLVSRITDHVAERLVARERALEMAEGAIADARPSLAARVSDHAASSGQASAGEDIATTTDFAQSVPSNGTRSRDVVFSDRRQRRRDWVLPVFAFLLGVGAAALAVYLFILKERAL